MDLPVWVNGEQLWVKGVEKKTTCDDIIKVLLGAEYEDYSLFEKWKGVERRLRGVSKVWNIWKEWGDAQGEVRLTVKKEEATQEKPRRRRKRERRKPESIEKLLKLILIQGETIQNQLKKLKEKEEEIKEMEEAKHEERVALLGPNYLVDSYFEKESDSGMVTEYPGEEAQEADPELTSKVELWEKIFRINKKLEKEEERLVKLLLALREYGEREVVRELSRLGAESDQLASELEASHEELAATETSLTERRAYLQGLCSQLEETEKETARLLAIIHSYATPELYVVYNEERSCVLEAIV